MSEMQPLPRYFLLLTRNTEATSKHTACTRLRPLNSDLTWQTRYIARNVAIASVVRAWILARYIAFICSQYATYVTFIEHVFLFTVKKKSFFRGRGLILSLSPGCWNVSTHFYFSVLKLTAQSVPVSMLEFRKVCRTCLIWLVSSLLGQIEFRSEQTGIEIHPWQVIALCCTVPWTRVPCSQVCFFAVPEFEKNKNNNNYCSFDLFAVSVWTLSVYESSSTEC